MLLFEKEKSIFPCLKAFLIYESITFITSVKLLRRIKFLNAYFEIYDNR